MTTLHMILLSPHAIRGPGKPRIVEPYKPFHCPYSWTLSGPVAKLTHSKRLVPVEDYIDRLFTLDDEELRRECHSRRLTTAGNASELLATLIDGLSDREIPKSESEPVKEISFRDLQQMLKDAGLSAQGTREELEARLEEVTQ